VAVSHLKPARKHEASGPATYLASERPCVQNALTKPTAARPVFCSLS
jgi:hypothetical protein